MESETVKMGLTRTGVTTTARMDPRWHKTSMILLLLNFYSTVFVSRRCDGVPDCPEGEDENDCLVSEECDRNSQFQCPGGRCINNNEVLIGLTAIFNLAYFVKEMRWDSTMSLW